MKFVLVGLAVVALAMAEAPPPPKPAPKPPPPKPAPKPPPPKPGPGARRLPSWPEDFRWSNAGAPPGWTCTRIIEFAEPPQHTWHDNFFCYKEGLADPGMRWSMAGPIAGQKCVKIHEAADPHTWNDNFLCLPKNSPYHLHWSSAGPVKGKACHQWHEAADPHTWKDNFLCGDKLAGPEVKAPLPVWPHDFKWSNAGVPPGYSCARIIEFAEPKQHTWEDNFFCWKEDKADPGIRWSMAGPIAGHKCTGIHEAADPHTWNDNFLCVPKNSPYDLKWHSAGPLKGLACIQWIEPADPHTWKDNFLCHEPNVPRAPAPKPAAPKGGGGVATKLPSWPGDFIWSPAGAPSGWTCTRILEFAEPPQHTWHDNFFCYKAGFADPGMRWSMAGPIAGQKCTQIIEAADPHTWKDNYLCLPKHTPYKLQWSSAGPLKGKECIKWHEAADPHTWNDNFLCGDKLAGPTIKAPFPAWPHDFKWSNAGVPAGYSCARILEFAEPKQHTWQDNFFCWREERADPGIRWSMAGPIAGHKCTATAEAADPHTWNDNFICVPSNSPYNLKWHSAGPIKGLACIQWIEPSDPHTWKDNYLCNAPGVPKGAGGPWLKPLAKIGAVSYTMVYGGYTWGYKTNVILVGGLVSDTTYDTKAKALTACYGNPKCLGVSYTPRDKKYRLNAAIKEQEKPAGMYWLKKGSSYTYYGRIWSLRSGYHVTGAKASTIKYTDVDSALAACASSDSCNAVNKHSVSELYLMKGTTVAAKSGMSCYIQGDKVGQYGGYSYGSLSGFYYGGGWISDTEYKTYVLGLKACSSNTKCTGVTKIGDGKYKLNSGSTVTTNTKYTLYPRGGLSTTKFYFNYDNAVFSAHSPYKMAGKVDGKTYTTRAAALDACVQLDKCIGFTQLAYNKYYLNSDVTLTKTAGNIAYKRHEYAKVSNGYMWQEYKGIALKGTVSTTTYETFALAAKACVANAACKGITYVSAKKWQLNSSVTRVTASGQIAWVKRGKTAAHKSYYWTEQSGYKGQQYVSTTSYSTLAGAQEKCLAAAACGGVTKDGSKYYLNNYHTLASNTGTSVYVKGGEVITPITVYLSYNGYTWKMKSHWHFKNKLTTKKYTTRNTALTACASNSKCMGISKEGDKEYYLGSGTSYSSLKYRKLFVKYGTMSTYGGYTWTYKKDYTLDGGYLTTTAYTTKPLAMTACKGKSTCKGVILKGGKYYMGKGDSFKAGSGYTTYKKTSSVKTLDDHYWSVYSDYTLSGDIKSYTTLALAIAACTGSDSCHGVTTHSTKVHKTNTGYTPSSGSGKTAYIKGSVYTSSYSTRYESHMYMVHQPYVLAEAYGSKITTRAAAFKACEAAAACLGFTMYGTGNFKLNKKTTKTQTVGASAYIKKGTSIISGGRLWGLYEDYKLTGYADTTKYASDSKAFTACTSSSTCNGVTKEGSANYRINTGSTPSVKKDMECFIMGSSIVTSNSYYWTSLSSYEFDTVGTTKYTTLADAKTACVKAGSSKCMGVSKHATKEYYLGSERSIHPNSDYSIYLMGGAEVTVTTVSITYGDYAWKMKKPMHLSGKIGTTKYTTRNKALTACAANTKCNGVTKDKTGNYYLYSGTTARPGNNMVTYIKEGKSYMASSTIWTVKSDVVLGTDYGSTKYTSLASALKACAAASGCKGVSRIGDGNYKLKGTSTTTSSSGKKSYIQGSSVTTSNDFYWTQKTGYQFDNKLADTAYTTKALAMTACAAKSTTCSGVSQISSKYYIMKGSDITVKSGSVTYVIGDRVEITSYMIFAAKAWSIHAPYALEGAADKKVYTTVNDAGDACMDNSKCIGFTRTAANKFSLNTKATLTATTSNIAYVKHSDYVQYNNRLWPKFSGYKLSKQYGSTTYTSDSAAMTACAKSTSCYGVSKIADKKYTLGSTTSRTKATDNIAYLKGDEIATSSSLYWVKKSGYSLNTKQSTKKYTDLSSAKVACAAASTCEGVVNEGTKKYYLYKDVKLVENDDHTTYLRTGDVVTFTTMTITNSNYVWTYKNPYKLEGTLGKTTYATRDKGLAACAALTTCNGVTKETDGKFYLKTGATPHYGKGRTSYIKAGKSVSYGGYVWTTKSNKKLSGYADSTTYTSLTNALKACKSASSCKGVTKEGTNKYRINSSSTTSAVTGYTGYLKGSSTESSNSYVWTPKSKYELGSAGKTQYKTKALAAAACAKSSSCTGYTKYGDANYKINTGSDVSVKSTSTAYVRGGYSKTSHTLFYADTVFHAASPYKYADAYGDTYSSLSDVLDACEGETKCLGFNYNGSKFQKTSSTTKSAAVGYVAYKKGGDFVSSDGYMWDHQDDAKLTGYYDAVTYTSDAKAYAVCAGSTSCKGITKEATSKYRTNTGSTASTSKGMDAYIQGDPFVLYSKYYWTEADGYTLSGYVSDTVYKTRDLAMTACLTSSSCHGVTKEGTSNYRANTGYTLSEASTMTAYVKGGAKVNYQSYSTTYSSYSWTFKYPHTLSGYADTTTYKTRAAALKACAANSKCLGVTKEKTSTYRLNSSSTVKYSKDRSIWVKGGAVVKASGVNWSKKTGKSFSGYYNDTNYKSLALALAACSSTSGCKGVTKEGTGKYRLNSSTTTKANTASTAYAKGSTLVISDDFYWTKVSNYKFKSNLSTTKYTTQAKALTACAAKSSTCSGVTYVSKEKYYLASGDTKESSTGAHLFIIGSNYKKSWTYIHADSLKTWVFKASAPYTMNQLVTTKTYTTLDDVNDAVLAGKGTYTGFTRIAAAKYQLNKGTTQTISVGKVAVKYIGVYTSYGGYMWAKNSGKKLSGDASTTTHKTLSAAMKACLSNTKCNGVTQESSTSFKENTGTTASTSSGKYAYILGDVYSLDKSYYWTTMDGVKLSGYADTTTYKTLSTAKTACAAASKCNGITYEKASTFRINTGDKPAYSSGMKVYWKGGKNVKVSSYGSSSQGYTWTVKKPFYLTGSADSTTYKTKKTALKACTTNSKCLGVTKESATSYKLNTGSTAEAHKSYTIYVKGGKSVVSNGKSWSTASGYSTGGLGSTEYTSSSSAFSACNKATTCNGVVKKKTGKYVIATGTTKTKATGYTSYTVSSSVTVAGDYSWTSKSDYSLSGYATDKTHTTASAALTACAANSKCNGVTKEAAKKYRLNSGSEPSSKSGYSVYIKGGLKKSSRTVYNTNYVFTVKAPYALSKGKLSTSKTEAAAYEACVNNVKCLGFTRTSSTSYILYSDTTITESQGKLTYLKGGSFVTSNGYMWDYRTGKTLSGYADTTKYSTAAKAMSACVSSSTCKGVTKEGTGNFRINTGSTPSTKSTMNCWIEGDEVEKYSGYYWSKKSDYTLSDLGTKKYTSSTDAKTACKAAATCTGVVKAADKEYYLATGHTMSDKSDYVVYFKGGKEVERQSLTMASNAYSWAYESPMKLSGPYSGKDTLAAALTACVADSKCKGVTYKSKKYYLATGSTAEPGTDQHCWIKQGDGNYYVSDKVWTSYEDYKLSGYDTDTTVYTTRAKALKACASSSTCNGVTKEASKKFRLNTGKSPTSSSGLNAYLKTGSLVYSHDYRYTKTSGYVASSLLTDTVYKTFALAGKACASNAKCTGITYVKKDNYRLYNGGSCKISSGAIIYPRGKYYTSNHVVTFANNAFKATAPSTLSGTKLGTAKTIELAMAGCLGKMKDGCNGFTWDGTQFTLYKSTKSVTPTVDHVAWKHMGKAVKSDGYIWIMKSKYRLVGYDDSTTYTTLTKATAACAKSDTCLGVTNEGSKKYRTNNADTPTSASTMTSYIRGNKWELHDKLYYTWVSGHQIETDYDTTTYATLALATAACKTKPDCSGVTYNSGTKKYRKNKGYTFVPSANEGVWVRGGVKPTIYSMTISYGGYTWAFKQPYKLSGYVSTTKYTTQALALTACAANSKCNGVTKEGEKNFRLNTGSTAVPGPKFMKCWVKGGSSVTSQGYSWGSYSGYGLGGMIGTTYYTTRAKALAACSSNSKCTGVVRNSSNKYFISSASTSGKSKKTNYVLYSKGSSTKAYSGNSYTVYSGYIHSAYLVDTVYKTPALAGVACAAKGSSCTGINKIADSKYKLTKDTTLKTGTGQSVYIKGGYDYTSRDINFGDELWTAKSPYTLSGTVADKSTYTARDTALKHCLANSACNGITLTGGKYTLYKSSTTTEKSGSLSWIRNGDILSSDNYHWDQQDGKTLSGYYDGTTYTTLATATAACAKAASCKGVTKEATSKYRTNTGSTFSTNNARTAYKQGDYYVIHDDYYFTKISGSKLGSIQTKAYTTEAAAGKACIADKANCAGFVLTSKKYYLAKGYMMYTDNDYTAFVRNHGKVTYVSYSTMDTYYWLVKGPFVHDKYDAKTSYDTITKCMTACEKASTCKGCSYIASKKKYYQATTAVYYLGEGDDKAYTKSGKAVVSNSYIWETKSSGTKISGDYLDSTTYTTLDKAMLACSTKSGCTGVTKTATSKYRTGKKDTTESKTGMQAYMKGSGVVTYKLKTWTAISDMVLSSQDKTAYTTYKKAMIACVKNTKCEGVNKSGDKYYLALGSHLSDSSGKKTYVLGESYTPYFTYDSTVWYYKEGYKTSGDIGFGTTSFTTRNAAMYKCARNPICNSVHYTSKKYHMRTGTTVTDEENDNVWVYGTSTVDFTKVYLPISTGLWNPRPGYKLKTVIGTTTYDTLPKATAACMASSSCKGVLYTTKTKKYNICSTGTPIKTTGYIAYPRKYACDSSCTASTKGKVVTIDLKYCFKVSTIEISNNQACCSKNTGKAVIKVGTNTCATVTMNGKTSALKVDCASGAVGEKITLTYANIGDIDIDNIILSTEGSDAC